MSTTYINFPDEIHSIYIPKNDLEKRTKYGWFLRLSEEQISNCDSILAKWLTIGQNQ